MPLMLAAQTFPLLGEVRATEGQIPIAYAVVRVAGTELGCVSNAEGQFRLELPRALYRQSQLLTVSCLGYGSVQVPVMELLPGRINQINLPNQALTLDEVMIFSTDLTPFQMVVAAFDRLADNYLEAPYLLHTFYRHYCIENGEYGRLIEAAIDLYDPHGHGQLFNSPDQKIEVRLRQLRRSLDFTRFSAYQHAPIALFWTLGIDYTSYEGPFSGFFRRRQFKYALTDTTILDGKVVLVIRADGSWQGWTYNCDLYLTAGEWAIVKIDEYRTRRITDATQRTALVEHQVASYQQRGDRYYLSRLLKAGTREETYFREDGSVWQTLSHEHHVELMVNGIETEDITPFVGDEPTAASMARMTYDPAFWAGYTVLAATPLEGRIETDLAKRLSLEQQFRANDHPSDHPQAQDIRAQRQLDDLLTQLVGTPVLLAFWDHSYEVGLQDLWRARKLITNTPELPLGVIFLSLDRNDQTWRNAIRDKKLYAGEHLRLGLGLQSPIARRYGVSGSPFLVLLNGQGQTIWQGHELPSAKEIETLIEQIKE
jgi:hypothetical protein